MNWSRCNTQLLGVGAAIVLFMCAPLPFVASQATNTPSGDAFVGKQLFEKRCTGCHALDRDKEGPRLGNVYGRQAGSIPSFKYSDGLKSAHLVWDSHLLDRWLTDPDSVVPDNDMTFHVPSVQERADIIRFLELSSGK